MTRRILIVGTGLIGGSIGLALRAAGFSGEIVGTGPTAKTLDTAQNLGAIDRWHARDRAGALDSRLDAAARAGAGAASTGHRRWQHQGADRGVGCATLQPARKSTLPSRPSHGGQGIRRRGAGRSGALPERDVAVHARAGNAALRTGNGMRSEEHTSELQSRQYL